MMSLKQQLYGNSNTRMAFLHAALADLYLKFRERNEKCRWVRLAEESYLRMERGDLARKNEAKDND
jgi:hypothetical protein